jgi:hypothetical protein
MLRSNQHPLLCKVRSIMSWLFAGVQKVLQNGVFAFGGIRVRSSLFVRVGVLLVYTDLGMFTTKLCKTSALRLPSPDPVARERFGAGLEFVQSDCVPTQHALAGGLRFSQAHLSIRD